MKFLTLTFSITALFISLSTAEETPKPLPADVVALKKSYEQAQQKALEPLRAKYIAGLQKLLEAHTKAGNLDGALAIREEMNLIQAKSTKSNTENQPSPPKTPDIQSWVVGKTWEAVGTGSHYTFLIDGTCKQFADGKQFTPKWELREDGVLVLGAKPAITYFYFKSAKKGTRRHLSEEADEVEIQLIEKP